MELAILNIPHAVNGFIQASQQQEGGAFKH
jgi:hypothetical protein